MENTDSLLAPRQLFSCPLENTSEFTIEKAKKLIYQCANEMGFTANHTPWEIQRFRDENNDIKCRIQATFTA